ncbi:MAG TPA: hypothetical protein VNU71_04870 [Burkholderiaceae bacterium]|nr:hypothetical protein [Burkholderiaceae bacterium]
MPSIKGCVRAGLENAGRTALRDVVCRASVARFEIALRDVEIEIAGCSGNGARPLSELTVEARRSRG